ncbi:Nuclease-related domain-containing protein [Oceanobacillus limi]|uniref:Nuclease-related domain-containing protein n=1 Tax=Oceanobacillus limi TaxID=930131 RepID=A0A1I0G5Z0_9BACI|nr:nuclease-related domain-containing protein [Oceanobacillus limi]SET66261.1 Nuclease-related domain-containing protein [Oceanobacillus limi]
MELKPHEKTLELLQLQVLDSRISSNHTMKEGVQTDLKVKLAEVKGEEALKYPLGFLEEGKYFILHNLRIPDNNGYFQIDTLVLSERYLLILEAKNWYGTLLFNRNGQVTRIDDDAKEEGFQNPIVQAKMQRYRLQRWLNNKGLAIYRLNILLSLVSPLQ